jgi:hypothetical protein
VSSRGALVCGFSVPGIDRNSGSRRIFDLVKFLQDDDWTVTFVAAAGVADVRGARALRQSGVTVRDGSTGPLEEALAPGGFDLALLAFWPVAGLYMPLLRRLSPRTRIIVDSVDLHFLRNARRILQPEASFAGGAGGLLDFDFASELTGELNAYVAADLVLTVSQKETDLLNDLSGDPALACTVPDCENLEASRIPYGERRGILTVGSYDFPPNMQAVEFLCQEVLPRVDPGVLAAHPVSIVGNGLNDAVRDYGRGLANVRMVGWVPSLTPYFERSRISVVPLRYGAGTKRKLIQSLMTGTPAVSTRIGVEGLNLRDGEHVLIADEPDQFARAIERLVTDEALWRSVAAAGLDQIARTHGPSLARSSFLQALRRVMARPSKPPRLPELGRRPFEEYLRRQHHCLLMRRIWPMVRDATAPGSTVIVLSDGSDELVKLDGRNAWHFPGRDDGGHAPCPCRGAEAVQEFEDLHGLGADYFLIPRSAYPRFDHDLEFKRHIESRYPLVVYQEDASAIYALRASDACGPSCHIADHSVEPETPLRDQGREGCANEDGVRLIAFYLPQFHPIPENDAWWGQGFTEWSNVARAVPLFHGHYQPHLPSDLGFYDLRMAEVRREQSELARSYGIHGFCYYHYWFKGKQLLERPFNEVLAAGEPGLPFCLCWANEPWSRRWDGRSEDVLQPQTYSEGDDLEHIKWLIPALGDRRAIRVEGRPVFLVYKVNDLPDPARTADLWRHEVSRAGLEGIFLIAVETGDDPGWDATRYGFDAKVLFQPDFTHLFRSATRIDVPEHDRLRVYNYQESWPILANPEPVPYRRYPTVFPGWDNTPRVGENAVVIHGSSPDAYANWLRYAVDSVLGEPPEHRIVFINAWNEWGEGCHLEPDLRHGSAYLEATLQGLRCPKSKSP